MKTCTQCKMRYPNDATYCFVEGAELVDLPDPRVGTLIGGRYVLEEVAGEGGMATVYRAKHKLVDRLVAVKIMNPIFASDPVVRERFRREARSAQKLSHPNIIEIFDQGDTDDGTCFIVMEFLHGESLSAITSRGSVPLERAVHIMIQIARGIARAHDLGVIHRDIKPENVFLCRNEDGSDLVKLLDFGIAKSRHETQLTTQGELFGTPQYMSPERIVGQETTEASDLYAMGVMFFEMIAGELPFNAPDIPRFFNKHMHEPPPSLRSRNPRTPASLEDLVSKMLAKAPNDRPVGAHRVHQDLLEILDELKIAPPIPTKDAVTLPPPMTIEGDPNELWHRRILVLDQMLSRAFGAKHRAPNELLTLLDQVQTKVGRALVLRNEAVEATHKLETIEQRGREHRMQLNSAVDQLGGDASKAKDEVRSLRESNERLATACKLARERFEGAHREVLVWEGRSGFVEPSSDLVAAYRAVADAVEAWNTTRSEELRGNKAAEAAEQLASDLEFQIKELRAALQQRESELDAARADCEAKVREHGVESERLESELLELTTRFCTPLRTRPELATLFKELETEAA